ncbi:hypothetical protein E2562_012072 [Oryza meyeriana var. granulata]|uniref:Uncharacterized protein n=1 Tax=Oryza meyeriana var. granulata TaxID=110450 RepID=A0A6G1F720_9ORYZ|nr:hypothetical protein E2562_012072 [Oryza meyeriana var. granulata]
MAEIKAMNQSAVAASMALLSSTGANMHGGGSGNGKSFDGGKKWKSNNKKGNGNGGHNTYGNSGRNGGGNTVGFGNNWRAVSPGGGPWFCFASWARPPPWWSPSWGAPWHVVSAGILGPQHTSSQQAFTTSRYSYWLLLQAAHQQQLPRIQLVLWPH